MSLSPIPDILVMSHTPCLLRCPCGDTHVAAIHNDITGPARVRALRQSAAHARWYDVDGTWTCPACYGSDLLSALMLFHAGQPSRRKVLDAAADRRADWCAVEVRR